MAMPPIQFDRASGALEGANLWERTAALALATGSKISSHFSHRGVDRRVRVDEYVLAPEPLEDLGPGDELSPPLGEEYEQLHRELLEPFHTAAAAQLVARQVQLDVRRDGFP